MKRIENVKVVLEDGILCDGAILTEGERILWVGKRSELDAPEAERVDASGLRCGPQ